MRGSIEVAVRCQYGYPQVVRVYPLLEGQPFPTLFWLTCLFLCRAVSQLENAGWIGQIERLLHRDGDLKRRMNEAHRAYIRERYELLSVEDRTNLVDMAASKTLLEKGIGGISDFRYVKCLHLHVAHALVRTNPVGEIVLRHLPKHTCPSTNVVCSSYKAL
ncbi:DUF501 domain-containing protein [Candidatus Bipolaricaulota bacterium]|nr:DUF501 domain-containing protein [Candidatus Bipolaricaulota bacterium]